MTNSIVTAAKASLTGLQSLGRGLRRGVVAGGLAVQLPDGLAKTIASYVTLILGGGGILSGGLTSMQPIALQELLKPRPAPEPPHFRVS